MNEPVKPRSFWGRVSEFVKNPTQDWSLTRHENAVRELEEQEHQRAREEQRKLDAFIRKRELAALRRLRKQRDNGGELDLVLSELPDTGAGTPQPSQREATLRKINEIERAMAHDAAAQSRQNASMLMTAPMTRPRPAMENTQPLGFALTDTRGPQAATVPPMAPTQPAPTQLAATQLAATQLAPTRIGSAGGIDDATLPLSATALGRFSASTGSDPSRSLAVDVQEGVSSSPLFDQACMDFANGNDDAAERALLEAISGSPERDVENEFWLALFDLYRAGNDLKRFEALVADYVERFQSSAPSWGSAGCGGPAAPAASPSGAAPMHAAASFTALGEFDTEHAKELLQLARGSAQRIALDFTALTSVVDGAQQPLHEALQALNAAAGRDIELSGLEHLLEACAAHSPAMSRDADPTWWSVRLQALRLAGSAEAFDSAALDYCVTYEISPPAWEPSRARVRLVSSAEGAAAASLPPALGERAAGGSRLATRFSNTETDGMVGARLEGEIGGGGEEFLHPLDEAASGHGVVVVDLCDLRRLDFASAGIMLNWVVAQSSAGRTVRFEGTHRLIAGLFAILGISSVAQVELRKA